jgi:hypothetical protein
VTSAAKWSRAVGAAEDDDFRADLIRRLLDLRLIAPADVRALADDALRPIQKAAVGTDQAVGTLTETLSALIDKLREDLVPEHMR